MLRKTFVVWIAALGLGLVVSCVTGCQPNEVHSIPDDPTVKGGKEVEDSGQGRFQSAKPATKSGKAGSPAPDEGIQTR